MTIERRTKHGISLQTRIFISMLGLTSLLVMVGGALYMYARYFEAPFLYYQNLPFPVETSTFAGDIVPVSVERCSTSDQKETYVVTHMLKNLGTGETFILDDQTVEIDPGCHRDSSKINKVPAWIKPGKYQVTGTAIIEMRVGQRRVPWYTEPFIVLPAKIPAIVIIPIPGPAGPAGKTGPAGPAGKAAEPLKKCNFWGCK